MIEELSNHQEDLVFGIQNLCSFKELLLHLRTNRFLVLLDRCAGYKHSLMDARSLHCLVNSSSVAG